MRELAELVRRSASLAEAGEWGDEARRVNERLVELQPNAPGAWLRLGHCAEAARDLEAAEHAFRTVIRLGADARRTRVARRRLIAIAEARRAEQVTDPADARRRALGHREAGKLEAADVWFRRAADLATRPDERIAALSAWASMLRTERRLREAHEVLLEATRVDASRVANKASFTSLAATLADLGQLRAARAELNRLHDLHPGDEHLARLEHRLAAAERRRG